MNNLQFLCLNTHIPHRPPLEVIPALPRPPRLPRLPQMTVPRLQLNSQYRNVRPLRNRNNHGAIEIAQNANSVCPAPLHYLLCSAPSVVSGATAEHGGDGTRIVDVDRAVVVAGWAMDRLVLISSKSRLESATAASKN